MDGVNGNKKSSKRCYYQNLNKALKEVEFLFLSFRAFYML